MSREDWEPFEHMRRVQQATRESRRERFAKSATCKGWTCHHETHYSRDLLGDRIDYWPGPKRWRWRGKTMTGDVERFIAAREREAGSEG